VNLEARFFQIVSPLSRTDPHRNGVVQEEGLHGMIIFRVDSVFRDG